MGELLTRVEIQKKLRVSRSTLLRWIEIGAFPKPLAIGPRTLRWRAEEVESWLDSRPVSSGEIG